MKKLLLALCTVSLLTLSAHAGDTNTTANPDKPKKPELTAEQKALKQTMLDKYDANKDGKLDKDEMSKMSDDDKAAWKAAFPHKKKSDSGAPKTDAPKSDDTK